MNVFKNTKEFKMVKLLEEAGEQAFFVGGCVRDYLVSGMNEKFKLEDIDICTSASPERAKEILSSEFSEFNFVGERFGVLMVEDVELAQFRTEVYTEEEIGKPQVKASSSVKEDASRRDFTMNALYMDSEGKIYDFFDGMKDIELKLVKAVGDAEERFSEDPSRILRMFYLASRFGFSIDCETLKGAQSKKDLIKEIPDALIGKIVRKVISQNTLAEFLSMIEAAGLLEVIFPEFSHTLNKKQNPKYHNSDVFNHTVRVIKHIEKTEPKNSLLLMAAWTHDIAKGMEGIRAIDEEGKISDLGHEEAGAELARKLCVRLQFGKPFASEVAFLVKWHGLRFYKGFKLRNYLKLIRKIASECSNKEELVLRSEGLLKLMRADASGFAPSFEKEVLENLESCEAKFFEVLQKEKFFVSELLIDGNMVALMWSDKKFMKYTGEVLKQVVIQRQETLELQARTAQRIVSEIESK